MAKYRKKPVVIDAVQYVGTNWQEIVSLIGFDETSIDRGDVLIIHTLEGAMRASPNDWIIRGIKGEFYPCKPDIFAATYEAVDGDVVLEIRR